MLRLELPCLKVMASTIRGPISDLAKCGNVEAMKLLITVSQCELGLVQPIRVLSLHLRRGSSAARGFKNLPLTRRQIWRSKANSCPLLLGKAAELQEPQRIQNGGWQGGSGLSDGREDGAAVPD